MEEGPVFMLETISRAYARRLVGQVLHLPAITGAPGRPQIHLKIIQIVVDQADPQRVVVHGIRVEPHGREFEGRTIVVTPSGIDRFLAVAAPAPRRRWQRPSPRSAPLRSPKR